MRSSRLTRRALLGGASALPFAMSRIAQAWPLRVGTLIGSGAGVTITGITLSNATFTGGPASGTVVGAIAVQTTGGSFNGALSLSGTNAGDFQIADSNLETNGVLGNGSYSINIVATQNGAAGSPFVQPEVITGISPNQLTTLTLVNTSASIQAANFITPVFGHGFVQGDIPAAAVTTGNLTSGQSTLSGLASTSGISAGQPIIMFGVPVGTTVVSVSGSTVTMSANAAETVTGGSVIFSGAPSFQISGVAQPYSWGCQSYWPDGSLKHASFMLRCGSSIAANGTLAVEVWSGGTAPLAGARTAAEVYAQNLVVTAVGTGFGGFETTVGSGVGGGIGGTWKAWLNGDANQPEAFVYLDGAAGKAWRFLSHFAQTQGGSAHGQLECYHYVVALTDSNGNLGGFRYLGRICQPWYNSTTPTTAQILAFTSVEWQTVGPGGSGTATVPLTWPYEAVGFTWNSGSSYTAATTPNWYMGQVSSGYINTLLPVVLSGTLPTGLSANQVYWASQTASGQSTAFSLLLDSVGTASGLASATAAGGSATVTPVPAVLPNQSLWTADDAAKPVFFQGTGSLTGDSTVRTQFDRTYLHGTKLVVPFDLSLSGVAFGGTIQDISYPYGWAPFTSGVMGENHRGGTGNLLDLGPLQYTHAVAFYNQSATDDQLVRAVAYAQEHDGSMLFRDAASRQFPNLGNTTYTSSAANEVPAPSAAQQALYQADYNYSAYGRTAPLNGIDYLVGENNNSHKPSFAYYAALVFGDPQFVDLLYESVVSAILETEVYGGYRNPSSPLPAGYGLVTAYNGSGGLRSLAWPNRDIQYAALIGPEHHPDGSHAAQYVRDMADASANYPMSVLTTTYTSGYCVTNGLWQDLANAEQVMDFSGGSGGFMSTYFIKSMCIAAARQGAGGQAQAWLNNIALWFTHLIDTFGGWAAYPEYSHTNLISTTGAPITSDDDFGIPFAGSGSAGTISWQSSPSPGPQHFSASPSSFSGWTLGNGDKIIFDSIQGAPGGFAAETPYWVFNVSGANFDLSSTPPGTNTLVAPTSNGSVTQGTVDGAEGAAGPWFAPIAANLPAASTGLDEQNYVTTESYCAWANQAFAWMKALGTANITVPYGDSSVRTAAKNIDWTNDPRFLAQDSFGSGTAGLMFDFSQPSNAVADESVKP